MTEKKLFLLLASTLVLLLAWRFFDLFLSNDKYDWFLFYDHEQTAQWYIYFTSNYLREIIYGVVIVVLGHPFPRVRLLAWIILSITILRLVIYWLFRGSQPLEVPIAITIILYGIIQLSRWRK